jgi:SAM-dependent methyltransferase
MSMPNPWTVVLAADYERHMGQDGVDQLGPLASIFQEVYLAGQPDQVLLLGCGTGNGLEHVDPAVTKRVVGVDVNLQHLGIARQRYFHLGARLELYCAEVEKFRPSGGRFALVHAALLFEYLHPEVLVRRIAEWVSDEGLCSVVLQLPGGDPVEAPSKAMRIIEKAARLVPPEELTQLLEHYGLVRTRERVVPLKQGRRLWAAQFARR